PTPGTSCANRDWARFGLAVGINLLRQQVATAFLPASPILLGVGIAVGTVMMADLILQATQGYNIFGCKVSQQEIEGARDDLLAELLSGPAGWLAGKAGKAALGMGNAIADSATRMGNAMARAGDTAMAKAGAMADNAAAKMSRMWNEGRGIAACYTGNAIRTGANTLDNAAAGARAYGSRAANALSNAGRGLNNNGFRFASGMASKSGAALRNISAKAANSIADAAQGMRNAAKHWPGCFVAGTPVATANGPTDIEKLQVGDRVLTPATYSKSKSSPSEATPTNVDSATWRKITLRLANGNDPAGEVEIILLRPHDWLKNSHCRARGDLGSEGNGDAHEVWIDLEEMGISGWAQLISVERCPEVVRGVGRVVTGTFARVSSSVIEIKFEGQVDPLFATTTHPLFSITRKDWTPAGHLQTGEFLRTFEGTMQVGAVGKLLSLHNVFNIEVEADHTYYVAAGQILAHNTCPVKNASATPTRAPVPQDAGRYDVVHGHHVHAKAAFRGHPTYDLQAAFSISQGYMSTRGWNHPDMTSAQRTLFDALAASGQPNTLREHSRIAVEALQAGGATLAEARALVAHSLRDLRAQGVRAPTRIPWN
ncbi:hypothetical protein DB346_13825, partial [Verrucomicrobia bacterium LW23]